MPVVTLGIDPGNEGAIAVFNGKALVALWDMPTKKRKVGKKSREQVDAAELARLLKARPGVTQAFLEEVGARPGQGVTSMFAFGRGMGKVEGVLAALDIDVVQVYPQTWTSKMNVWEKGHSCRIAAKLLPDWADSFLHHGSKNQQGGRADAVLIGWFGLNHWRG